MLEEIQELLEEFFRFTLILMTIGFLVMIYAGVFGFIGSVTGHPIVSGIVGAIIFITVSYKSWKKIYD